MKDRYKVRFYKQLLDLLIISIVFLISSYFAQKHSVQSLLRFGMSEAFLLLFAGVSWFFLSRFTRLYDELHCRTFSNEFVELAKTFLLFFCAFLIVLFFFKNRIYSRFFTAVYFLLLLVMLISQKYLLRLYLLKRYKQEKYSKKVLIVGATEPGINFAREIERMKYLGYQVCGFLDDRLDLIPDGFPIRGKIIMLNELLAQGRVDIVAFAISPAELNKRSDLLRIVRSFPVKSYIIPEIDLHSIGSFSLLGKVPIFQLDELPLDKFFNRIVKRGFDLSITLVLFLLLFWWLIPLIALLIKIDSSGPILFRQKRIGEGGKIFTCLKFRTMFKWAEEIDENGNFCQAKKNDSRVTKIGKLLRKTNLDELPQLINVLKGEMSLVGPRPHAIWHNREFEGKIANYSLRHRVKPGLTGLAQINGFRGETDTLEKMEKRILLDIYYSENWTFGMDLQIILKTIWLMLRGDENAY